jgi:hypothetical protein
MRGDEAALFKNRHKMKREKEELTQYQICYFLVDPFPPLPFFQIEKLMTSN